jgi:cytochrome c556
MRSRLVQMGLVVGCLFFAWQVFAHEKAEDLPAGPIRDRHTLMEGIGDHAKKIGAALKQGTTEGVAAEADGISAKAKQIDALFPKGSTDPKSRAKPEIWEKWAEFERLSAGLEKDSAALAQTARDGGDVPAAAKKMFGNCKSCHDQFRVPDED